MRSAPPDIPELLTRDSAPGNRRTLSDCGSDTSCVQLIEGAVCSSVLAPGVIIALRALSGAFWITLEGDPNDYVLHAGETLTFTGPGLMVTEGLREINEMEQVVILPNRFEPQS